MFNPRSLGLSNWLPTFLTGSLTTHPKVDLPSVPIHDIEENSEKRARTLKHLIKANHINYSIIYHDLRFHNHTPHILGSAYLLGANSEQLNTIYDSETNQLESWKDSPGEISKHDWRDYLGKREYQRAFIDFYEDMLVLHGYDWRDLLNDFLFQGSEPLINNMIAGLGHPLIHLGYAYELSSRTVAIEALGLVSCFYNSQHKYLDDPSYTKPSSFSSTSLLELLDRMHNDDRFSGLFTKVLHEEKENMDLLLSEKKSEALMLEYWNAWTVEDLTIAFKECQRAAVGLLVGSHDNSAQYDFFLCHLLTSSHAVRIILPLIDAKWHINLVRQWWLFVVSAYMMQGRPAFDVSRIEDYDIKGREWKFVDYTAVNSKWATDAHFVKACRAMKEAANTWGDNDDFFMKAAVKLADEFSGWGFGSMSKEDAEYYSQTHGYIPRK